MPILLIMFTGLMAGIYFAFSVFIMAAGYPSYRGFRLLDSMGGLYEIPIK